MVSQLDERVNGEGMANCELRMAKDRPADLDPYSRQVLSYRCLFSLFFDNAFGDASIVLIGPKVYVRPAREVGWDEALEGAGFGMAWTFVLRRANEAKEKRAH